jgi:hypothetical protein
VRKPNDEEHRWWNTKKHRAKSAAGNTKGSREGRLANTKRDERRKFEDE